MVPWYVFALMSAIFGGVSTVVLKKGLKKNHAMEVGATLKIFEVLIISIFLFPFIDFSISIKMIIWIAIIALGGTIASIYTIKAYRHEDISLIGPLFNLSPLFLIILSAFLLKERITLLQFGGIFILAAGTYILEADHSWKKIQAPFKKMFSSKYTKLLLLALVIYSFTSIGDKYVLEYVKPLTLAFYAYIFVSIDYIIVLFLFHNGLDDVKNTIKDEGGLLLLVAILSVVSVLFYFQAASLAMISLVIPIKRVGTLIQTVLGGEMFHEKKVLHKSIACAIMIVGATILVL